MTNWKTVPILFLLSCLALPAAAARYETDHDGEADFASFQTYAWREVEPVGDDERVSRSDLVVKRARRAIEEQLEAKGLAATAPEQADLIVEFRVQVRERVDIDDTGFHHHSRDIFINSANSGTAIVDLIDRRQDSLVWRGWAHELIRDGKTAESRIRRAMLKLFRDYPPAKN